MKGARSDEQGQITLLVLGLAAIAAALVVVAVDASSVFLARRSLAGIADGAALAAAQSVDVNAIYRGTSGAAVPLTNDGATGVPAVVAGYLAEAAARYPGLAGEGVTPDGRTAAVQVRRTVRLPFAAVLGVDDVTVTATATARARLTG